MGRFDRRLRDRQVFSGRRRNILRVASYRRHTVLWILSTTSFSKIISGTLEERIS
jgi:hypothetical protein